MSTLTPNPQPPRQQPNKTEKNRCVDLYLTLDGDTTDMVKAPPSPMGPPVAETPPHTDNELSEGEAEILELETRLKVAQEAHYLKGASGGSTVISPPMSLSNQKINPTLIGI